MVSKRNGSSKSIWLRLEIETQMYLLNVNGLEKYTVLCEHPDSQTWKNFIMCFNVRDIDVEVRTGFELCDCKIINDYIEYGGNKVTADHILPVEVTKSLMTYPRYETVYGSNNDVVLIEPQEGRHYSYSLWNNVIGMGETILRAKNNEFNIDLCFLGVDYINMPVGSNETGILIDTEKDDEIFINNRLGRQISKENIHVFLFGNKRRYIVGTMCGFFKNHYLDFELTNV